jgi:hypothetical protein
VGSTGLVVEVEVDAHSGIGHQLLITYFVLFSSGGSN